MVYSFGYTVAFIFRGPATVPQKLFCHLQFVGIDDVVAPFHAVGLVPLIFIRITCEMPARRMLRTAVRRKSWKFRSGTLPACRPHPTPNGNR